MAISKSQMTVKSTCELFQCKGRNSLWNFPRKQNVVSHPSAYKNSVRGEAIYYLYLEVKGQMRLFLQV